MANLGPEADGEGVQERLEASQEGRVGPKLVRINRWLDEKESNDDEDKT